MNKFFKASNDYKCVFKKDIFTSATKEDQTNFQKLRGGIEAKLQRRVMLPFVPQKGMVIKDYIALTFLNPKNMEYVDGFDFDEKIEQVVWNNPQKHFVCQTADYYMSEDDEIGLIIIRHMNMGWFLDMWNRDALIGAIKSFVVNFESEIIKLENEQGNSLDTDREFLRRIKIILKEQYNLMF